MYGSDGKLVSLLYCDWCVLAYNTRYSCIRSLCKYKFAGSFVTSPQPNLSWCPKAKWKKCGWGVVWLCLVWCFFLDPLAHVKAKDTPNKVSYRYFTRVMYECCIYILLNTHCVIQIALGPMVPLCCLCCVDDLVLYCKYGHNYSYINLLYWLLWWVCT